MNFLDTSLPVSTYVARRRPIAAAYFLCAELRLLIDVVYHCGVPLYIMLHYITVVYYCGVPWLWGIVVVSSDRELQYRCGVQ